MAWTTPLTARSGPSLSFRDAVDVRGIDAVPPGDGGPVDTRFEKVADLLDLLVRESLSGVFEIGRPCAPVGIPLLEWEMI